MKHIKKVITLLLAAVMVLAMSSVAFAAGPYEVTAPSDKTSTHTYEIYQVFTGTVKGEQLTNLKYGANAVGTTGNAVSQTDMASLKTIEGTTYADDQAKITALLPFVNLNSTPIAKIGKDGAESAELAEGYYIIKDKDGSLEDPDTYTLYMFKVIDSDIEIEPKDGTTTSDKELETASGTAAEAADYNIGDSIPYTLTATLPDNYAMFKDYYLKFVDDMSAGLTLDTSSVKIHYGESDTTGTAITLSAVSGTAYTGGQKYEYEITDLKKVTAAANLAAGDKVWITYNATLNANADLGNDGNPNKSHVVYSNNPNNTGSGNTNETPDDTTVVFTFGTVFDKVDGDGNPLTGADFKLEKKVGSDWVDVTTLHTGTGAVNPVKTGSTTTTTGEFTFSRLSEGEYKLTETTTPSGYNTIDPITFTISATYTEDGVTALTGTTQTLTFTSSLPDGTLTADVVNESGAVLPSTGGIGTIIFYVLGSILVVGCGIVLISRRRVNTNK